MIQKISFSKNKIEKFFIFYLVTVVIFFLFFLVNQSSINLSISYLFTLLFFFPVGYASLIPIKKSFQIPNLVKLPIYLGVGFAINIIWSYFLSPFIVNPIVSFLIFIIAILFILGNIYFKKKNTSNKKTDYQNIIKNYNSEFQYQIKIGKNNLTVNLRDLLILLTLIFLATLFAIQIQEMGFPKYYADSISHSFLTAVQISEGRLATHPPFLPEFEFDYLLGEHFLAANLALLFNLTPGETFLILGGVTAFLIFSILFSITYQLTKSSWLGLIVLLSAFHIPVHEAGIVYLLSFIHVGAFPNLGGIFHIFLLLAFLLITKRERRFSYLILTGLLIVAGLIMYPFTIVYLLTILSTFFIFDYIKRNKANPKQYNFLNFDKKSLVQISSLVLAIVIIGLLNGGLFEHVKFVTMSMISEVENQSSNILYLTNISVSFVDDFFNISIFVGIFSSLFLVFFSKQKIVGAITLIFLMIFLLATNHPVSNILTTPQKFMSIIPIFGWIALSVLICSVLKWWEQREQSKFHTTKEIKESPATDDDNSRLYQFSNYSNKKRIITKYVFIACFGFASIILLVPDIPRWENFSSFHSFADDIEPHMEAFNWINNNVNQTELIFDYRFTEKPGSWGDAFFHPYNIIPALEYKKTLNTQFPLAPWPNGINMEERKGINEAFLNYYFLENLNQVLLDNDIKYILASPNKARDELLQNYKITEIVFQNSNDVIMKVTPNDAIMKITPTISLDKYIEKQMKKALESESTGDFKNAVIYYGDILKVDFGNLDAIEGKYRNLIKMNDDKRASQFLVNMMKTSSEVRFFSLYSVEREARSIVGLTVEDETIFEKEIGVRSIKILESLAEIYEDEEEPRKLLLVYNKILEIKRFDVDTLKKKGIVLEKLEEFEQAKQVYELAFQLDPNDVFIQHHLDEMNRKLGS